MRPVPLVPKLRAAPYHCPPTLVQEFLAADSPQSEQRTSILTYGVNWKGWIDRLS